MASDVFAEVFSAEVGWDIQEELNRRYRESKTLDSPGEIHEAMSDLCRDVMTMLNGWVRIGKRSVFGEGCVLFWVEKFWQDLEPLHDQYDSFHDFAVQETGEEYSTFRGKIAVYRMYVLNEDEIEKIAEIGAEVFLDIPMGKLQKARGAIRRGEMTEQQWDALIDPNVRDRHFHHIMKQDGGEGESGGEDNEEKPKADERITVDMGSGSLTFWQGAGQIGLPIGYLDVNADEAKVREAVDAVIESAKIARVG